MTQKLVSLTATHAQRLAVLHSEGFEKAWTAQDFSEILAMPGTFGWALQAADPSDLRAEALSAAVLSAAVLARQVGDEMEILTLVVARAARQKGQAKALMQFVADAGQGKGAKWLFLEVADDNEAALSLYRGLGFEDVGRRPDYYGRKPPEAAVDARIMRLALSGCAPEAP